MARKKKTQRGAFTPINYGIFFPKTRKKRANRKARKRFDRETRKKELYFNKYFRTGGKK